MEPRDQRGAVVPLFDRLTGGREGCGQENSGPPPSGGQRNRFQESICQELKHLLNTRLAPGRPLTSEEAATVTGYGIPEWSGAGPASEPDLRSVAQVIAAQVERFEPRLTEVRVSLRPDRGRRNAALGVLEAVARDGGQPAPLSFALALNALGAAVEAIGEEHATSLPVAIRRPDSA
jgi:type VI secretion system protein ImpF